MQIVRVLFLLLALVAQSSAAEPATEGFVAERLDRIDRAIEAEIKAGKIPGAVALIVRNGNIVYHRSFGYADIAAAKPMQNDAIFRIASMTKAITTVAVMTLYEQGLFQLNDPVAKYIPEFASPKVVVSFDDDGIITETRDASREIRIIDLLTHSSGLGYSFVPSAVSRAYQVAGIEDGLTEEGETLSTKVPVLAQQPLLFDPGSAFAYGLSTDVLGFLVEIVSGKSLDQYFADAIFAPLGLQDTYFFLPAEKSDRLVTLYADVDGLVVSKGDEADIKLDDPNYPIGVARTYFSGGGGLSSTAYDYARFIQMLLNEGQLDGVRLLGRKSVELMRTPRIDWNADGEPDFGLGFRVVSDLGAGGELGSVGTYSWGGAFFTSYWIDPQERLVAVLMSQLRPSDSDIDDRFKTLVYQALE
jgi:CubicO group peptidase (beta-lactamase class C family)